MTELPDDSPAPAQDETPVPATASPADDVPSSPEVSPHQVWLRRAPRYRSFVSTGVFGGALTGVVVAFGSGAERTAGLPSWVYLTTALALVGGILAAALAVLLDRPRR